MHYMYMIFFFLDVVYVLYVIGCFNIFLFAFFYVFNEKTNLCKLIT